MNISFVDNNSTYKLEGCLVKVALNGTTSSDIFCVNTGSSPTSATTTSFTTIAPSNLILDYNNYQYIFRVRILNGSNVISPWPSNSIFFTEPISTMII